MEMKELEQYFKALGDGSRLRILNLLLEGELCVCDIQRVLGMRQPHASRHLAYLKNSGLVRDRREGYRVYYRLAEAERGKRKGLYAFLEEVCREGESFREDGRRLRKAMVAGACARSGGKSEGRAGGKMARGKAGAKERKGKG